MNQNFNIACSGERKLIKTIHHSKKTQTTSIFKKIIGKSLPNGIRDLFRIHLYIENDFAIGFENIFDFKNWFIFQIDR